MILVIIGNGFDSAHKLGTEYSNFRGYLHKNDEELYSMLNDFYDLNSVEFWKDFEESLGKPMNPSPVHKWVLQNINCQHTFADRLLKSFAKWANEVNGRKRSKKYAFDNFFKRNIYFLSFNYTNTLERLYNISNDKIFYIHGNAEKYIGMSLLGVGDDEKIVLGHKKIKCDDSSLNNLISVTEKPVQVIIENSTFFRDFNFDMIDDIYVYGFSFSDVDCPYIMTINNKARNARWHIYYHDEKTLNNIKKHFPDLVKASKDDKLFPN